MTEPRNMALAPTDQFSDRHIGPRPEDIEAMLQVVGASSLSALMDETLPDGIRTPTPLSMPPAGSEQEMLTEAQRLAELNQVARCYIGMGYHPCVVPPVILRNILCNPGWYTQYTPYQAEISQGRLEALLNFQTMICDLTGMDIANASMLDEGTSAAEGMTLCYNVARGRRSTFLVADDCHPQTLEVIQTRAQPLGIQVQVSSPDALEVTDDVFGVLVSYPSTDGRVRDWSSLCTHAHDRGAMVVLAADLLSLALLRSPGAIGADVAVGSTQRFGVPMGFGGPHAAFFATHDKHKRRLPGRLVGISRDTTGVPALRLALQTREQHIRRDRATSNICTAQVLLAVMAAMYGTYHGPEGIRRIAARVRRLADTLAQALAGLGLDVTDGPRFDTVAVRTTGENRAAILQRARDQGILLRELDDAHLSASLHEATLAADLADLVTVFAGDDVAVPDLEAIAGGLPAGYEAPFTRESAYLQDGVFNRYHSEHELLRYIKRLESRDLSLTTSMIPLGSCTMKLNAAAEMLPITHPGYSEMHPFAPTDHTRGYGDLVADLEKLLAELTGLPAVSLQPNAGSQGEFAGLLAIRRYHDGRGETRRNICLIPASAHGTNPASAVMAGMKVMVVACDEAGNIDVADLEARAREHHEDLAALMVTYPSTHGVFEASILRICEVVHEHGGQVYMDGANMNAMVGLCRPGELGVDVLHLNLHKTFTIPHGGGGPGVGPIAAVEHLRSHLPSHGLVPCNEGDAGAVASAPWGSASILPISWMYIRMMGGPGLTRATEVAILNANYLSSRLAEHYPILYTGANGRVAHEFILDLRPLKKDTGVTVFDVAKRLMDFGFHAPTVSFPVAGTFMIEPTESESRAELDRFCDAMIAIRQEIRDIEEGRITHDRSPLAHAPHTAQALASSGWEDERDYTRDQAAFPLPWLREHKYWPVVGRIDDAWGDRNLVCTCGPLEAYTET